MENKPRLFGILLKTTLLFVLFNFAFILISDVPFGKLSLYNSIFPGRERFPFGNVHRSYNLSLLDLDAMFSSHVINNTSKTSDEYRVLLIGDSSVWGTLLTPEQTLAGQLNASNITACGKTVHAYNLGYPTISLTKDLLIMEQAKPYHPDLIIWFTTLEAFPWEKQLFSPIVVNNARHVRELITNYQLPLDPNDPAFSYPSKWEQTFVGRRQSIAALVRLQMYGVLWASTGIDQVYPADYERPQSDVEADEDFHGLTSMENALAFEVLDAGMSVAPNMLLINEPMFISTGINSDIRYNFYYPRWVYDEYRSILGSYAAARQWNYLDYWDIIPMNEFTNTAIHRSPAGEALLSEKIAEKLQISCQ